MASSIVDYGTLKAAVADYMDREDLGARIPDFIDAAHKKIQKYAGALTDFGDDSSVNDMLIANPMIYLYGAITEGAPFVRDTDILTLYGAKFQAELDEIASSGFPYSYDSLQVGQNSSGYKTLSDGTKIYISGRTP